MGLIPELFTHSLRLRNGAVADILVPKRKPSLDLSIELAGNPNHDEKGRFASGNTAKTVTSNENFRKWFGDSKVVNADGSPMVVFHGTLHNFDTFKTQATENDYMFDRGVGAHFAEDPAMTNAFTVGQYAISSDSHVDDEPENNWYRIPGGVSYDGVPILRNKDAEGNPTYAIYDREIHGSTWFLREKQGNDYRVDVAPPGGHVYPVYLSIKKPLVVDVGDKGMDQYEIPRAVGRIVFPSNKELFVKSAGRAGNFTTEEATKAWDNLNAGKPYNDGLHTYTSWDNLMDDRGSTLLHGQEATEGAKKALERLGYDGIKYRNTSGNEVQKGGSPWAWIAFEPGQIKSAIANKGTFDSKQKNITAALEITEDEPLTPAGKHFIAVDLDGTLAVRQEPFNPLTIGKPIPKMIDWVRRALKKGHDVCVFTARLSWADGNEKKIKQLIRDWTQKHIGKRLEVTNEKSPDMTLFVDDKAVGVVPDKGIIAKPLFPVELAFELPIELSVDTGERWVTIHGSPVLIKDGQSIGDAIKEHFAQKSDKAPDSEIAKRVAEHLSRPPKTPAWTKANLDSPGNTNAPHQIDLRKQFAAQHNMSVDEYDKACQSKIDKLMSGAQLWRRCGPRAFGNLLEEPSGANTADDKLKGRFVPQFETNTSMARLDPTRRDNFEKEFLGYPEEDESLKRVVAAGRIASVYAYRPIYSAILSEDDKDGAGFIAPNGEAAFMHYGKIAVHLKDDVKGRSTLTGSDSLEANIKAFDAKGLKSKGGALATMPSPITKPDFHSWDFTGGDMLDPKIDSLSKVAPYVESQIYGQVRLKDVAEVVFYDKAMAESFGDKLKAKGISWRVAKEAT